jgi:hypothetical protein
MFCYYDLVERAFFLMTDPKAAPSACIESWMKDKLMFRPQSFGAL